MVANFSAKCFKSRRLKFQFLSTRQFVQTLERDLRFGGQQPIKCLSQSTFHYKLQFISLTRKIYVRFRPFRSARKQRWHITRTFPGRYPEASRMNRANFSQEKLSHLSIAGARFTFHSWHFVWFTAFDVIGLGQSSVMLRPACRRVNGHKFPDFS